MYRIISALTAVSLFALAAPASAATTVITPCPAGNFVCMATQPVGTTFSVSGGNPMSGTDPLTATIGHTDIAVGGFTDLFSFTIGTAGQGQIGTGSGSVITFLLDGISNVDFTSVFFNNGSTDFFGALTGNSVTISGVPIFGGVLNTLHVQGTVVANNGTNVGSYGGALGFKPAPAVPEPGTWAMMLLGFGGMGVALRRRRRSNSALMQIA